MVHGFLGGSAQWDGQVAALSDTRDVITIDLPGFGKNAELPAVNSIAGFADFVIDELTASGVDRFHLLGHSMGGMIVQEVAHRIPDRIAKLILYATGAVGVLPGRFETIAESKSRAQTDGAGVTARRIAATWFLNGANDPAYDGCAAIAEQAGIDAILAGLDAMQEWSGDDALSSIKPETLVIWGDRDRTYRWPQIERLWTAIPHTNLSVFPNCAHAVHLENPNGFNDVLSNYLK
jgi:pimeloyl-ACP methyl ester carboxylesterase